MSNEDIYLTESVTNHTILTDKKNFQTGNAGSKNQYNTKFCKHN